MSKWTAVVLRALPAVLDLQLVVLLSCVSTILPLLVISDLLLNSEFLRSPLYKDKTLKF